MRETTGPSHHDDALWIGLVHLKAGENIAAEFKGAEGAYVYVAASAQSGLDFQIRVTDHFDAEGWGTLGFEKVQQADQWLTETRTSSEILEAVSRARREGAVITAETWDLY